MQIRLSCTLSVTGFTIKLNSFRKLYEYHREHSEASDDALAYLSNPVNAYLLTKRLTVDWQELENVMNYNVEQSELNNPIPSWSICLKFISHFSIHLKHHKIPRSIPIGGRFKWCCCSTSPITRHLQS